MERNLKAHARVGDFVMTGDKHGHQDGLARAKSAERKQMTRVLHRIAVA
jgi:hypothetical protein